MVGFGFMDNFIMIQAGGYIDSTLGVKFGLATLTAAAMGQVVSDVSGVLFGNTVDNAITRTGLVKPSNLSPAQRLLPISRRVSLAGAVLGVIIGCGLGATSLCFVPHHEHSEAREKWEKMKEVLSEMLRTNDIECDDCTVYLVESPLSRDYTSCGESERIPSSGQTRILLRTMSKSEPSALHQQCLRDGATTNNSEDGQFICAPIYGKNNTVLGMLEFAMKRPYNREREEQFAQITARHIGIVLDHCF
jgi:hypothetical protein